MRYTSTHVTGTSFVDQEVSLSFVFTLKKILLSSGFILDLFLTCSDLVNRNFKSFLLYNFSLILTWYQSLGREKSSRVADLSLRRSTS